MHLAATRVHSAFIDSKRSKVYSNTGEFKICGHDFKGPDYDWAWVAILLAILIVRVERVLF